MKIRLGNGFDFHRVESGDGVILAGVHIDCPFNIIAHSDGDIIIHTIVDAILGGLALGDIGTLFPETDKKWQNADSKIFLQKALDLMNKKKYGISNIDITIICEKPKIRDIKHKLSLSLQQLMSLQEDQVSIKATTTEKMGFIGRGEGIGCFATVCLMGEN